MIEFALTGAGGHRVRFRLSPLDELLGAIQVVLGHRGHPVHHPWLAATGDGVRRLPVGELMAVLDDNEYTCDFLSPPPEHPKIAVEQQLAQVRRTPPEQVAHELHLLTRVPIELTADPRRARDLLADQLELAWQELMAPYWPQVRDVLLADITYRSAHLAEGGLAVAIADLAPMIRIVESAGEDVLTVRSRVRARLALDRRGLLLVPSAFTWPKVGALTVAPWQPAVLYPARGVGSLWSHTPRFDAALAGLLGRTKADLLVTLDFPATTTALARRLGLAPSTVSEHLSALRAGGLLATTRRGTAAHHARTPLGDALLNA